MVIADLNNPSPNPLSRRTLLKGVGLVGGAALLGINAPAAYGDTLTQDLDWRRGMTRHLLESDAQPTVRPLQGGFEVWEGARTGYAVVDADTRIALEYSATASSPFRSRAGELSYLGPGLYFASRAGQAVDLLTGETSSPTEHRALSLDAASLFHEQAIVPAQPTTRTVRAQDLDPVLPGNIKSRVTSYGYITGSYVYPNNSGICGWVAGSIVTRYWHARSSARKLLPTKFRNGTNMTASPNFASHLQGSGNDGTWARPVANRLGWNAQNQGVAASWSWVLGNVGAASEVRNNRPVILFGSFPVRRDGKKGGHAVVAYGETHNGYYITHYGWANYTNIVLNGGLVGSNAKFRLN